MNEMLKVNMRQNLQVVVQIATKYSDLLGPVKLIEMFEQYKTFDGKSSRLDRLTRQGAQSVFYRTILLPWLRCQPQRRPRGQLQVHSSCDSNRSDPRGRAYLPREQPLQPGEGQELPEGSQDVRSASPYHRL